MGKQKGLEWEHVSIVKKNDKGMHVIQCNYCNHAFVGGPHRIRAHILGLRGQGVDKCINATDELKIQIRRLVDGANANGNANTDIEAHNNVHLDASSSESRPVPTGSSSQEVASTSKKRKLDKKVRHLDATCEMQLRKNADEAVRRFFYAEDIPHGKVESSFFRDMLRAIANAGPSYKPPSSFQLRKRHLDEEVKCVESELLQIRETWKIYGCTIVSDGWANTKNRPIVNVLASSIHGTVFLRSIDTGGQCKSGEYIFNVLRDVILDVGPSNVVQVCMDSAANCVEAGHMIEKEWPSIFYTRCTCHCLDLLFEDIAKCSWVANALQSALQITTFIAKNQSVLTMFRKFSEKEFIKPSTTRFAYNFVLLSNLLDERVYGGFTRMVASEEWCKWKGSETQKAREVVSIVMNDSFWSDVKMIVKVCKPILKLLRLADREGATMGLIYQLTNCMMEEINGIKEIDHVRLDEIKRYCIDRWVMLYSPLHATGFVLHPIWRGYGQESNHEVNTGWLTTIMRYASDNEDLQGTLLDELYVYRNKQTEMLRFPVANDQSRMSYPIKWWEMFGTCTPNLRKLAIRVLSQGTCASPCERNLSIFSLIHTKRRNRLTSSHVEKLVYLHTNLRLITRIKERGFSLLEVTLDMINKENDEDRLLMLQKEQEELQREETDACMNVEAYIEDNMEFINDNGKSLQILY